MTKGKKMKKAKIFLITIFGTFLTGMGIGLFLTPNKIVGGGVSGLSTILYHTAKIPPGISFFLINGLFLLIGLKSLGKDFTIKTLIDTTSLSIFVQFFSIFPICTENPMVATVFGGVLYGLGIGICFAFGASTGGTDILGRMVQKKFCYIPIGKMLLTIDGIIILISLIFFKNIELTLYGIISLYISSCSIDFVIGRLNVSKIAFVITDKGEEISQKLVSTSPRGVTLIDVKGAYTEADKKMLFCALKDNEIEAFQSKIMNIDETAFIVFAESQGIKGNGFLFYK